MVKNSSVSDDDERRLRRRECKVLFQMHRNAKFSKQKYVSPSTNIRPKNLSEDQNFLRNSQQAETLICTYVTKTQTTLVYREESWGLLVEVHRISVFQAPRTRRFFFFIVVVDDVGKKSNNSLNDDEKPASQTSKRAKKNLEESQST